MSNINGQSMQPVHYNSPAPQLPLRKKPKNFFLSIHMVPIIMGLITIIAPFVVGIVMFNIADNNLDTAIAPFSGIVGFAVTLLASSLISIFVISLVYLIFKLSKNILVRVFQILSTVFTGLVLLPILILILYGDL